MRQLLVLLGIAGFISVLAPAPALAHTRLERARPAEGAHLAAAPRELALTFSEAVELTFTRLRLLAPDSVDVALGTLRVDSARTVVAAIRGPLVAGTYTVVWQVAGADGHPIRGRYAFTIAPGAAGLGALVPSGEAAEAVVAPGQEAPPAAHHDPVSMPSGPGFDAESPAYVAVRWLQFTALLVVIGAIAFHLVVLGFLRRKEHPSSATLAQLLATASGRTAALGLWAAPALAIVVLLRLFAQSYAMHGPGDALNAGLIGTMLTRTTWGWGWLLQIAGVVLAAAGFWIARRRASRAGWALAALGAIALAFTPALSGHAIATPRFAALAVLADTLHVVGAGGWLGSLLFVVAVGIPAALRLPESERGSAVADLVNAFSPTALAFAGLAATTGVFAAWLHLGSVPALWQTPYGRTLLLKLAVISVVVATGAYNWRRVRPALGDVAGAARIRRSATVELAVGLLVLVVTAMLVATPTSMDATTIADVRDICVDCPEPTLQILR
ncbi:MAG: copper resistance protein CopC [Gemmatimonadota bacterium]|nr:copper resistance protein CopC [Gemmatimonadota bacterium]